MILTGTAVAWTGPFEILNETFFDGDWSDMSQEYNLPPDCGCSFSGRVFVIASVSGGEVKRAYAREYRHCDHKDNGLFGETVCSGDGCWVDMVSGHNFFITQSLYDQQSDNTKSKINRRCGGVVPNDWQPFYGDPKNPYDVEIKHQGVIWGYVEIHFKQLSNIDGEFCIPDESALMINSGAWESVGSRENKRDNWGRGVRSVESETTHTINDGIVTAKINITVRWYHSRRDGEGDMHYNNHTAHAIFYDSKPMPRILNDAPNASAIIISNNNSVSPYTEISVLIDEKNTTSTEITYKNRSSTYYNQIGVLTENDELKYYDFMRDNMIWKPDNSKIVTMVAGRYIINEAPLLLDELSINVSTPYRTKQVIQYNTTLINSKPSDFYDIKGIVVFVSMIAILISGAYISLKGGRR